MKTFILFFAVCAVSFCASAQAPTIAADYDYGGSDLDFLTCLQQTTDGGYIYGGESSSPVSGDKSQNNRGVADFWIVKTDASGNKIFDKRFGGTDYDEIYALQQTSDGGYILGGFSESGANGDKSQPNQGIIDYWIVKTDADGNKLWDKTFGGNQSDVLFSLQQTTDGGYILGGKSESGVSGDKSQPTKGESDFWVVKTDANGNKLWDKDFGGNGDDEITSVQQTTDGGYILAGNTSSLKNGDVSQKGFGGLDYWMVKIDANGNKLWDRRFGGNATEVARAVIQTSDHGYLIGGYSASGISGNKSQASRGAEDYWIVKTNKNGKKIWDKRFGGSMSDELEALQQTKDGGYVMNGLTTSNAGGDKSQNNFGVDDYWVIKVDGSGTLLWDEDLGGTSYDEGTSLDQTTDGGYIIGGGSESGIGGNKTQADKGPVGSFDYWVIKLNGDGLKISSEEKIVSNGILSVYPNPSDHLFTLDATFDENISGRAQIEVFNSLGQRVSEKTEAIVDGRLITTVQFSQNNAPGNYFLRVIANGKIYSKQVVIQ